eukprot:c52468_g1_i1.p2 GENE.c52468_g1_i1~~c52468_g1_i1.p2  ORF type:complete len:214 (+),score=70.58 c52468_g1_i1:81-644(+)
MGKVGGGLGMGGSAASIFEKLFQALHKNIIAEFKARNGGAAFDQAAADAEEKALAESLFGKYDSNGMQLAQCKNCARDYVAAATTGVPPIVHDLFEEMFGIQIASFRSQGASAAQISELESQKEAAIKNACDSLEAQLKAFGETDAQLDNTAAVLLQTMDSNQDGKVTKDEWNANFLTFVKGLIPRA